MKLVKPYTNKQYADLAVYCNKNGLVIKDQGDYLESIESPKDTKSEVRNYRNQLISEMSWRVERASEQKSIGIESEDNLESLLRYRQYLRDYTEQENWDKQMPLKYDDWMVENVN